MSKVSIAYGVITRKELAGTNWVRDAGGLVGILLTEEVWSHRPVQRQEHQGNRLALL